MKELEGGTWLAPRSSQDVSGSNGGQVEDKALDALGLNVLEIKQRRINNRLLMLTPPPCVCLLKPPTVSPPDP